MLDNPMMCVCGADARIREKGHATWVECRKKCGMRSRYFYSNDHGISDQTAKQCAVTEWNTMIKKCSISVSYRQNL